MLDRIIDSYNQVSIKDGIAILEQLYSKIMNNPMWIYPNKIDFNNLKEINSKGLSNKDLSAYIDGKLLAKLDQQQFLDNIHEWLYILLEEQ